MRVKTSELAGRALDWAVAKAADRLDRRVVPDPRPGTYAVDVCLYEGEVVVFHSLPTGYVVFAPSTDWAQGGPIIDQEFFYFNASGEQITATKFTADKRFEGVGPTYLIAAMRCYVAAKLGDEVEIPKELI